MHLSARDIPKYVPLCPLQALANVALLDGSIAMQTQPTPQEVARVLKNEPLNNTTPTTWLNLLLSSYAGLQLLNSIVAFNLLQQGYGACTPPITLLCNSVSSSQLCACQLQQYAAQAGAFFRITLCHAAHYSGLTAA
jgi:hypothetical protein